MSMHNRAQGKIAKRRGCWAADGVFYVTMLVLLLSSSRSWGQTPGEAPEAPEAPGEALGEAPASTAQTMQIGEILAVAIRHEPDLTRASVDMEIADAQLLAETGADDWLLKVTGSLLSTRLQPFNVEYDQVKLEADVHRALPTGGTLSLHTETGYIGTSLPLPGTADTYQGVTSATLSHPLLRGRGTAIARARQETARIARSAAELQQQHVANRMVSRVVQAYWELLYVYRVLEIARDSLENTQTLLENTQARIETGTGEATEALAVQQSIAMGEQQVLQAEVAITRASLSLRKVAGLEIGPDAIDIAVAAPLAYKPRPLRVDALLEEAFTNSPELALLEAQLKGANVDIRLAEDGHRPALDVALTVGTIGASEGLGDALGNMVTFDDLLIGATVVLEHDLGGRAATGKSRQSHARSRQVKLDLADAKARLAQALIEAIKQAELAQKQIEINQRIITLAQQNVEAERTRFELDRSTNFDVIQRQEDLRQAELRQARSIVEYLKAVSMIDALTGTLLPKYGITLDVQQDER